MPAPFEKKSHATFLAPMQDITDADFMNTVASRGAPDFFCAEYFRVHAQSNLEEHILRAVLSQAENKNTIAQIIGEDVFSILRTLKELKKLGVKFIDLNLGCPAPKIYRKNVGGGLLRNPKKISEILNAMRGEWDGYLSVKMRTGFSDSSNFEKLFETVISNKPDFVSIHARSVAQLYRGKCDYSKIGAAVKMAGEIPIVANGDLLCPKCALKVISQTSCDGAMIGRHAVRNPWIFKQISQAFENLGKFEGEISDEQIDKACEKIFIPKMKDLREYVEELLQNMMRNNPRIRKPDSRLKKFLNFVGAGVDENGEFLHKMRRSRGIVEMMKICDTFMLENENAQKPFRPEPFENLCPRPNHEA